MNSRFNSSYVRGQKVSLARTMRLVWQQHVYWTRRAVISLAFNLPDVDFVIARLLRNPEDMGRLLIPFYGDGIAAQFTNLIGEHLVIAVELVKAAKAGNNTAVAVIQKRWYANGAQIAYFLSTINPYISKNDFKEMFFKHLELTKMEAVFTLQKDLTSSIAVYNDIVAEALQMADIITVAIMNQFPKKLYG